MTDKVKQMAPLIWEEIQKANNILLHLHPSPDPDSVGSALAMMYLLTNLKKTATVIKGDSDLPDFIKSFPGVNTITLKDYFEINPQNFDLFIVLDSSTKNMISKKNEVVFPPNLRTIKIDHHQNNSDYADINLVDTNYCATSHILFDLMKEWHPNITPEIAACLFAGIYHDTGGFKYPPSDYQTLLAASELAKIFPDYFKIIFDIENSQTPKQIEFLALALNSIEHYFSNKVAVSFVSYENLQERGINKNNTKNVELPNILKSVPGWIMGISAIETSPDVMEIGIRRREYEGPDLSKLAIALGGGGHKSAGGGIIKKPFHDAKKYLIEKIGEVYPEFGSP